MRESKGRRNRLRKRARERETGRRRVSARWGGWEGEGNGGRERRRVGGRGEGGREKGREGGREGGGERAGE